MKKFFSAIDEKVSAFLLIFMVFVTFVNVISRYILHASISASEELASLLFILLSLFGSAIAVHRKAHLGLTVVTDHLSKKGQDICEIIGNVLGTIFCAILFYEGLLMTTSEKAIGVMTPSMNWPEWIFCAFIPIGCVALIYRFVGQIITVVKNFGKEEDKK